MIQTIVSSQLRNSSSVPKPPEETVQNTETITITTEMSTEDASNSGRQTTPGVSTHNDITAQLIRQWVLNSDNEQPHILQKLVDGSCDKARKKLVQIVCAELVALFGNYPSSQNKEEAAKAIISAFPKLQSDCYSNGYKHFYDKETNMGFLPFRFKTMRKNLNPEHRKRKASVSSNQLLKRSKPLPHSEGIILSLEDWNEKTFSIKYMRASEENKTEVFKIMDEIRSNRIMEIFYPENTSNMMTITAILDKYPKLKDYDGELIEREYLSLYPNGDTFLGKFLAIYVQRILLYIANDEKKKHLLETVHDLNDDFKALVLLPEIFPTPNYTKNNTVKSSGEQRKVIPQPSLIRILNNQEDILAATKAKGPQQPYLVYVPVVEGNPNNGRFYIRADFNLICVSRNPIKAFDTLLKMHFCFGVEYAPELLNFYDFITACIMGLEGIVPRPCCAALKTTLLNFDPNPSPIALRMDIFQHPGDENE